MSTQIWSFNNVILVFQLVGVIYSILLSFGSISDVASSNTNLRNEFCDARGNTPSIPKLICISERTKDAVDNMLQKFINGQNNDINNLIHSNYDETIIVHPHRGYALLGNDSITKEISSCSISNHRPTWFVFSGIGSQWPGIAKDLMNFRTFRETIQSMAGVMKTEVNFDLLPILFSKEPTTFDHLTNSFVCITATQIALTNLLENIGIIPDGIIGHSSGEIACAFADRTLNATQAILLAYWRGTSVINSCSPTGGMAAVRSSLQSIRGKLPPDIEVACDNSADSVTISGPKKSIEKFCVRLKSEGILAREVQTSGFAFHTKHIRNSGPVFLNHLKNIIQTARPRSSKWISSSIPENRWNTSLAMTSSADYHANNLISPVRFREALEHIPNNAIVIEIAPHALLQPILKNTLHNDVTNIGLIKKTAKNKVEFLLTNIGKYYNAGGQSNITNLYSVQ